MEKLAAALEGSKCSGGQRVGVGWRGEFGHEIAGLGGNDLDASASGSVAVQQSYFMPLAAIKLHSAEGAQFGQRPAAAADDAIPVCGRTWNGGFEREAAMKKAGGKITQPDKDSDERKNNDAQGYGGAHAAAPAEIFGEDGDGDGGEDADRAQGAEDAAGDKGFQHDEQETEQDENDEGGNHDRVVD